MAGDEVQRELDRLRESLYGGRGPGIGEEERERRTTLRPCVGRIPTAWLREELRLRTMRTRGEDRAADLESRWAQVQYRRHEPEQSDAEPGLPQPCEDS